ncbi:MFS transporter [Enterococcus sp. OL5]|uniref:MFS transporter n=1 Tax=Enterococcus sp. OL5 TaxID=2590214 RepID=UPI00112E1627|nr:MFS transporter [Enterococcus sp. OL5]TPR55564.1 hypothetical protein FJU10_16300 [Enterococcus sp. OL5]
MAKKKKDPNQVGMFKFVSWVLNGTSLAVEFVLLGYLMLYSTSVLGLHAGLLGTVLLVSKILDGVVDLFFGILIDRTNTRWGRGRPYDLFVIVLWVATWLLFSTPVDASATFKYAWIFIFYTLSQTVARSLLQAAGLAYQVRAFNNDSIYIKLNSWGGILTTLFIMVFNIIAPIILARLGSDAGAWSRTMLFISIPMCVMGMLRFFAVKEVYEVDVKTDVVKFSDFFRLFKHNKFVVSLFLFSFLVNCTSGIGLGTYFFQYVVGDLAVAGYLGISGIIPIITLALYPFILKRYTIKQLIIATSLLALPAAFITYYLYTSLFALAIAGILNGISTMASSYMLSVLLIDQSNYNESQGLPRMEGVIAGLSSFFNNTGASVGAFLGGLALTVVNLQSGVETQSAETIEGIRLLHSFLPAVGILISLIALHFYKYDAIKPKIDQELKEKRNQQENNATVELATGIEGEGF